MVPMYCTKCTNLFRLLDDLFKPGVPNLFDPGVQKILLKKIMPIRAKNKSRKARNILFLLFSPRLLFQTTAYTNAIQFKQCETTSLSKRENKFPYGPKALS